MTPDEFNALQARIFRGDLVRARIIAGISRGEVARSIGATKRAIRNFEEGAWDPRLSFLRRYALAIGVVIQYDVRSVSDQTPGRHAAPEGDPR